MAAPPPPPPQTPGQEAYQKGANLNIHPLLEATSLSEAPNHNFHTGPNNSDAEFTSFANPESPISSASRRINLHYQLFLDKISPHWKARWAFSLFALGVFMIRVVLSQGWYVICYALAIYYLNLLIGFLSPKVDPSLNLNDDDGDDSGPMLPTRANDEFKPFIRRLPEFKFWISGTRATLISLFLTLFDIFDVPVFWPILLIYFIILFACTMRQQVKHMIRYSYVPWDSGKRSYNASSSTSTTV